MSSIARSSHTPPDAEAIRLANLGATATFRNGGLDKWRRARIALIGAGVLGGPLAVGIVLSGAAVGIFDFDVGVVANRGTQFVEPGVKKVETLVRRCDEIARGRTVGYAFDVRAAGVGFLDRFDLFIDCSDDPNLALPLTEISNGLGKPLLRCALDGSGELELGRILCSSTATGHACQICGYRLEDLRGTRPRTACLGATFPERDPTRAGGAAAMVIAGAGLLSAQRLITGNDDHLVLGRETYIDLSHLQITSLELPRSESCLSGHLGWDLHRLERLADETTFRDLFTAVCRLGVNEAVTLEPYLNPLNIQAACACRAVTTVVGTDRAASPLCADCGHPMQWRRETQITRLTRKRAADLGFLDTSLTAVGLPSDGALMVVRSKGRPPLRLLLDCRQDKSIPLPLAYPTSQEEPSK